MFKDKSLGANMKILVVPVLALLVLVVLFLVLLKSGYSRVASVLREIDAREEEIGTLNQRITVLRRFNQDLSNEADAAYFTLPDKNTTLVVLSQMKSASAEVGATISNVQMVGTRTAGQPVESSGLTWHGQMQDIDTILNLLNTIDERVPLTNMARISSERTGDGGFGSDFDLQLFWSPLPRQLPALTEPLQDLTQEEEELLRSLANRIKPDFLDLSPEPPQDRTDPFN